MHEAITACGFIELKNMKFFSDNEGTPVEHTG